MTMKSFAKKGLAVMGAGAIAAMPMLAFANGADDNKNKNIDRKAYDETSVSINIANNGAVLIRGAEVTDVTDSMVTARTVVNGVTFSWSVDVDGDTSFVDADGKGSVVADISDGNYVSFSGTLTGATSVDADTVRNWSVGDEDGSNDNGVKAGFWGKIKTWPMFNFFGHAKVDAER